MPDGRAAFGAFCMQTKRLVIILILLALLQAFVSHMWGSAPQESHARHWLSAEEAKAYLAAHPDAILLDVRSHHEFVGYHLEGSLNYPLFKLNTLAETIPAGRPVIVIDLANARSIQAYKVLRRLRPDITELYYVKGRLLDIFSSPASRGVPSPPSP